MRIWFDLSNSPHINLFEGLIQDLRAEHEVVITCRPLANTVALLELHGLPHTVVGKHYGKRFASKLWGYPVRVLALRSFLARRGIDVAVSQSSFHSPLVGRLIGARAIYTNDNEHALGNVPAFLFSNLILLPEFLSPDRVRRQGAARRKIVVYPGVKEGIYLWRLAETIRDKRRTRPPHAKPVAYVRPEPRTAQYYRGGENFLDATLVAIRESARVVVLPRDPIQAAHYAKPAFAGLEVAEQVAPLVEIAADCDLFIGAGGTMTREMAVLGVPTVSVYRGEPLEVDRHLIRLGRMAHHPDLSADHLRPILQSAGRTPPDEGLLEKGRAAYALFKDVILEDVPRKDGA